MEQIHHRFFKLKQDFHIYKKGDKLLFSSHFNDVVLLASPTTKTQYYTFYRSVSEYHRLDWYRRALSRNLLSKCEPLTKKELIKLFSHLTTTIKQTDGYFQLAQYIPENICTKCMVELGLEIRPWGEGWKNSFRIDKFCGNCKKKENKVYFSNALKPINL